MKKALIIPNPKKDPGLTVTYKVKEKLFSLGVDSYIEEHFIEKSTENYKIDRDSFDFLVVVGGDGTLIDAARYAIVRDIPIIGVNLGRVGYLSEIEPEAIDQLESLANGTASVSERMLLSIESPFCDEAHRYAVNDIVISHESYLGIASIRLEDSAGNSIKYRSDGLILSTPQGSTAYSLSAGGPIVAHDLDSVIATPVCAHSFFNRSVIFNAGEHIKVTNISNDPLNVSVDGRFVGSLPPGESCTVSRADKRMKMFTLLKNSMFSNLFNKMKMLEDNE